MSFSYHFVLMPAKIAAAVVIDNGEFTPAINPDANVD
jgi:hypothetical protein